MVSLRRGVIALSVVLSLLVVASPGLSGAPPTMWQRNPANPVLGAGAFGSWDSNNVIVGSLIEINGTFHLWYYGSANNFNFAIGHATSTDGLSWTRDPANPILSPGPAGSWEERGVAAPEVIYEGGQFKMWYSGNDNSNAPGSIGYATSPDGTLWTKYAGNPVITKGAGAWDSVNIVNGGVVHDASGYRLWYSGSSDGLVYRAGLASSSDGIVWTKYAGNPVMDVTPGAWDDFRVHPTNVLATPAGLVMFYVGSDGATQRIGAAFSKDGVSWTKSAANPILDVGAPGAWDSASLSRVHVLPVGLRLLMWYSGTQYGADWQIGVATLGPSARGGPMSP